MQVKRRREKPVEISVGDVVMLARDHGVRTYTQLVGQVGVVVAMHDMGSYTQLVGQVGVVVAMHDMGSYLQSLATVRFFTQDRTWSVYAHRLEVLDAQDG